MSLRLAEKSAYIAGHLEAGTIEASIIAQRGVRRRYIRKNLMQRGYTREEANQIMESEGFAPIEQRVQGGGVSSKPLDEFKRQLFSKKLFRCEECNTRIGNSRNKRRRMAVMRRIDTPQGSYLAARGFQTCPSCALSFEIGNWDKLPNIAKEIERAELLTFGAMREVFSE